MMGRDAAMVAAGSAAVASSTAAGVVIWLLLTRPLDLVDAARGHEVAGFAKLAVTMLYEMLLRLLDLL
jgi:hypothetical protein